MSRRRSIRTYSFLGLVMAAFSIFLLSGCAGGPSQEELSLLEEKRQAVEAAQKQVEEKKAEKARLERKVAEKKATKKALEEKRDATKAALTEMD
jgi:septal ring factor EnvC (AmiA/AmiB activator)